MLNNEERMKAGMLYNAAKDGLFEKRMEAKKKLFKFNNADPVNWEASMEQLKNILGKTGEKIYIEPPFRCDYGENIEVGENFYANYNLVILDICKVKIGDNAFIAPNVAIYTAGHPLDPKIRNAEYEYGAPITIGNNCWIGGNTVILPGVTIGDNVVIGAGSVVTKDIPDNAVAVGNPCKIVKNINDVNPRQYFKDKLIDDELWGEIEKIILK